MDSTLTGVIIGAAIAALPQIIVAVSTLLNAREQRQHDLRVCQLDMIMAEQQKCYSNYLRLLGMCREECFGDKDENAVYREYCEAYEAVMLYASDATRRYLEPFAYPGDVCDAYKKLPDVEKHLHDDLFAGINRAGRR